MEFNNKVTDEHYFEHTADIGICGYGSTIEECFVDAAVAMFALMADLSQVHSATTITFEFTESDIELAFVTWLNYLVAKAQAHHLIFAHFKLSHKHDIWYGEASGELWRDDIKPGIEVKGATLTQLFVKCVNDVWKAQCVVDV